MDTGTAKSGKRAGHVPGRGHEQYPLEPMRLQRQTPSASPQKGRPLSYTG